MQLSINGQIHDVLLSSPTVAGLLRHLQLETTRVAVEVNGMLVKRAQHQEKPVAPGDAIEIVTLVGGG
jgi:thiamine biosynthesis protein ThiS